LPDIRYRHAGSIAKPLRFPIIVAALHLLSGL
jgi:hypothetical protein